MMKSYEEAIRREIENDGVLSNKYCNVWFDIDKKTIYGKELVGERRSLVTSGKREILKSWHDVVLSFNPITTIEDVKKTTSKYGYTILE